jgi:hypothetical protein
VRERERKERVDLTCSELENDNCNNSVQSKPTNSLVAKIIFSTFEIKTFIQQNKVTRCVLTCPVNMTVPVEINLETENQNYRMFLQKNDNMIQLADKQPVSF